MPSPAQDPRKSTDISEQSTTDLPEVHEPQPTAAHTPTLPIRFDARRASDRIRARIYHDGRLAPPEMVVALVIAEHASGTTHAAALKQSTIARWAHMSIRAVRDNLHRLRHAGVLLIHRGRTYQRYVFTFDWLAQWTPLPSRGRQLRSAGSADHDRQDLPITGEPVQENLITTTTAREGEPSPEQLQLADELTAEGIPIVIDGMTCREAGRAIEMGIAAKRERTAEQRRPKPTRSAVEQRRIEQARRYDNRPARCPNCNHAICSGDCAQCKACVS